MDYFLPVSPDTLAQHLGPPTRANDDAPRPSGREIRVLMHPGILMPTQAAAATHGSALPVVVSIGALVVAILAVFINLSALPRWPKVRVRSGEVQDAPPVEGTVIVVTARRRPVEVTDVGLVSLKRTWRRRVTPWDHVDRPVRWSAVDRRRVPVRLEDGSSIETFVDADNDEAHMTFEGTNGTTYVYVEASGVVYLKRERDRLKERLVTWRRRRASGRRRR